LHEFGKLSLDEIINLAMRKVLAQDPHQERGENDVADGAEADDEDSVRRLLHEEFRTVSTLSVSTFLPCPGKS
jgi:hypothetical protein